MTDVVDRESSLDLPVERAGGGGRHAGGDGPDDSGGGSGGGSGGSGDDHRGRRGRRGRGRRRPLDRGLMIASAVIGLGFALIAYGVFVAQTGDDGIDRPAAIERLSPVENALQVLQQESIVVDLEFGYRARLIIDGIEIETVDLGQVQVEPAAPGEQVEIDLPPVAVFDVGNSTLTFTPTPGAAIESFADGLHQATVIYWRIEDGPEQARSYTWSFNVV